MLKKAPTEQEVYPKLIEFLGEAMDGNILICAHNARFDISFLGHTFARLGYKATLNYVDTLRSARDLLGGFDLENFKLNTVGEFFQIYNKDAHRAESDAEVCGFIFYELVNVQEEVTIELSKQVRKEKMIPAFKSIKTNPKYNRVPVSECKLDFGESSNRREDMWLEGETLREEGKYEEALLAYDKVRELGYCTNGLYDSYITLYNKLNDYENVIDICNEALLRLGNVESTIAKYMKKREVARLKLDEQRRIISETKKSK